MTKTVNYCQPVTVITVLSCENPTKPMIGGGLSLFVMTLNEHPNCNSGFVIAVLSRFQTVKDGWRLHSESIR